MGILFFTRWLPSLHGSGTQQRAASHLGALAGLGRVHLLYIRGCSPTLDEQRLPLPAADPTVRSRCPLAGLGAAHKRLPREVVEEKLRGFVQEALPKHP